MLTSKHLALVSTDLALCFLFTLIADEHDLHIWASILFCKFKPASQVCKSVSVSDVIDEKNSNCAANIHTRDSSVSLLACRIPNFKLYSFRFDLDRDGTEIRTDIWLELLLECISNELI